MLFKKEIRLSNITYSYYKDSKNVLENFVDIIEPMYEKNYISLIRGDYEIQITNWLLREKRLTRGDIRWDGKTIREYNLEEGLPLKWTKSALIIGDYVYHINGTTFNIEKFLFLLEMAVSGSIPAFKSIDIQRTGNSC